MATQLEVLKTFMATLNATSLKGTAALDSAIKACSNFNSFKDFKNKIVSDCKSVGNSEKFLRDYCGIILGNADTGAISGADADNGIVKTAKSIVPESGDLEDFTGDEFTVDGLTVKLGKGGGNGGGNGKIKSRTFSNLSTQEKYIWQSLYTYWLKDALKLISESYGENFSFNDKSSAVTKTMYIVFDNANNGILAATWGGPDYAKKCTDNIELHINLHFYKSATGEDGIPNSNQNYLDRIIAHELTHAVMRANIDYYDCLPKWLKEGMAELTHGIDDKRSSDIKKLAGNSNLLQKIFSGSSVAGIAAPSYSGGYLALHYLAKQAANTYVKNFDGTDEDDQLETHNDSVTLSGSGGNDSLGNGFYTSESYSMSGGDKVYLLGGAGNDSLLNCGGNFVIMTGGTDDDSIINHDGKNVMFTYNAGDGNDSIVGFNETSMLKILGDSYSTMKSDSDVVVTVGDGKITLKDATALKTLNITNDEQSTFILSYDDSSAAEVTLTSGVKLGDSSIRTKAIKIVGNALDNSILGGAGNDKLYGQDGDDMLNGGAGNDTLTGGDGADIFIYNAGNDVITDYASGDKILLNAAVNSATIKGSDSVLKIGNGSLTIKNAKILTLIDSLGKELSTVIGSVTYDNKSAAKITLSSGVEVGDASSRTKTIKIVGNELDNSIFGGSKNDTLEGQNGADYLLGNAGNDKLYGQDGNDTLGGGVGNDTLTGGDGSDVFIYSAGKDVITDYASGDKISLGAALKNYTLNGKDAVLTLESGKLTVKNSNELTLIDSSGKEFTTIISSLAYDNKSAVKVTLASGVEVGDASSRTKTIKIVGNELDNSIFGGSKNDTLEGQDGADYLAGNAGNDKLYGQDGNDTLGGDIGNDTLTGGDGSDVFIYSAGKDVITDYASGDKISLGAALKNYTLNGKDAVLTLESGKLTVKNSNELTLIDSSGKEFTTIISSLAYDNKSAAKVTLASGVEVGDASSRTKTIRIVGNELDNSIFGGSKNDTLEGQNGADYLLGNAGNDKLYGQDGNDTLWGGIGNDTLTGGKGADVFIYSAGKDVITDFDDNDLLQITETFSATYKASSKTIAFKVASTENAITMKKFTATTFNINGDSYHIIGNNFVKK